MSDWKNKFLVQVLSDIPAGSYRDRLAGELSGHLDGLAQTLEAGGASPEAARALALERMGDREELRRSVRDEYLRRRAGKALRGLGVLGVGFVLPSVVCVLTYLIFRGGLNSGFGLMVYYFAAAVLPPFLGAIYLRHTRPMIALGVPVVWLGGVWALAVRGFLFENFPTPFWEAVLREEPGFRVFTGEGTGLLQLGLLAACLVLLWAFEPLAGVLREMKVGGAVE